MTDPKQRPQPEPADATKQTARLSLDALQRLVEQARTPSSEAPAVFLLDEEVEVPSASSIDALAAALADDEAEASAAAARDAAVAAELAAEDAAAVARAAADRAADRAAAVAAGAVDFDDPDYEPA
jgi:hypothetical protein